MIKFSDIDKITTKELEDIIFTYGFDECVISFMKNFNVKEIEFYKLCSSLFNIKLIRLQKFLLVKPFHRVNKLTNECVVIFENFEKSIIAIFNPCDYIKKMQISNYMLGREVIFVLATRSEILEINSNSKKDNEVIAEANNIIITGIVKLATDIHFKAEELEVKIFFRINGEMKFYKSINSEIWGNMKRRLKVISDLDTVEEKKPQSGSAKIFYLDKSYYVRISTHPGVFGENITVRLQNQEIVKLNLDLLGFDKDLVDKIRKIIKYPKGLFLLAGPVGVGKTTTIYSILKELYGKNIMTIEDPVEIFIQNLKQTDIHDENTISYSECIRSLLRHDPDVIFVGEIRDSDTAKAVIRAVLTGRLVFSTIHSYDIESVFSRITDFGIDINELVPNMLAVMSQRLLSHNDKRFVVGELLTFSNIDRKKHYKSLQEFYCSIYGKYETLTDKALLLHKNGLLLKEEITNVLGEF